MIQTLDIGCGFIIWDKTPNMSDKEKSHTLPLIYHKMQVQHFAGFFLTLQIPSWMIMNLWGLQEGARKANK